MINYHFIAPVDRLQLLLSQSLCTFPGSEQERKCYQDNIRLIIIIMIMDVENDNHIIAIIPLCDCDCASPGVEDLQTYCTVRVLVLRVCRLTVLCESWC